LLFIKRPLVVEIFTTRPPASTAMIGDAASDVGSDATRRARFGAFGVDTAGVDPDGELWLREGS
jgi:hypothetical protein